MKRPEPHLNTTFVAFIDILGFKKRLFSVQSREDLLSLYKDVRTVHQVFGKHPSLPFMRHPPNPASKNVIALSDALVVSINFDSPLAKISGILDTLAGEISFLALCQATCAANGLFLRGGLAVGYHFRDNSRDILLSSAMVRAYDTEKQACYPLLAVDQDFYTYFVEHPDNKAYADQESPANTFFLDIEHPRTGRTIHCLDYFHLALGYCDNWFCPADLELFKAEKDGNKKKQILNDCFSRTELRFVTAHRDAINTQLAENHPTKVQKKYLWLKEYHNKSVDQHGYGPENKI